MNLQHVNVKIFVEGPLSVDLEQFIVVFHRWVAEQSMEELLIDVADYSHVPAGPGVVMVGLEADYAIDNQGGRYGLLYNRKAPLDGSNEDRMLHSLRSAAHACDLLEGEFAGLKFSRSEFEIFIKDRALAPNNDETFAFCKQAIPAFVESQLDQSKFKVSYNRDPRCLFGATVQLASPFDLAALTAS